MIIPRKGLAKLISKRQLSDKVTKVTFEVIEPTDFIFDPGQFLTILISDKQARVYSICSRTKDLPIFSMAIETGHDGAGANYIKGLNPGDKVNFIGPSGRVTLPEVLPNHLYFFATGTGVSPFMALLYRLLELHYDGEIDLFYGVRKESEALFVEELESFRKSFSKFNYKISHSKPDSLVLASEKITSMLPNMDDRSALYFLCGHPLMAEDMYTGLLLNGINEKNIIREEFRHPGGAACS
jgi:ferredoxin-NADP reductase